MRVLSVLLEDYITIHRIHTTFSDKALVVGKLQWAPKKKVIIRNEIKKMYCIDFISHLVDLNVYSVNLKIF